MNKIPMLFEYDSDFRTTRTIREECMWVVRGEGVPTEKLDGTNVRLTVRCGDIVRVERRRNPTREEKSRGYYDPWYQEANRHDPDAVWILDAAANTNASEWPDGEHCCEAIGPKIQGNPLGLLAHTCVPFNLQPIMLGPSFPVVADLDTRIITDAGWEHLRDRICGLQSMYEDGPAEGIVWHHPDGRRCKLRRKDFGRVA